MKRFLNSLFTVCSTAGLLLILVITGCDQSSSTVAAEEGPLIVETGDENTAEALRLAAAEFKKHATIDGDEAYTVQKGSGYTRGGSFGQMEVYSHCKGLDVRVIPQTLSESDKLNGIEWKGNVEYDYRVYRSRSTTKKGGKTYTRPWSEWKNMFKGIGRVNLTKKNGQWYLKWITGTGLLGPGTSMPVAMADLNLPKE